MVESKRFRRARFVVRLFPFYSIYLGLNNMTKGATRRTMLNYAILLCLFKRLHLITLAQTTKHVGMCDLIINILLLTIV